MATGPSEVEVIYIRLPATLKRDLEHAADEDERSLTREAAYLLRLGLRERARLQNAAGRPAASRDE